MRRILFLWAIALVSLLPFYGCDDENKIFSEDNDKPAVTDSIPAASIFEYVDLGLSVNWATCNVGATNPWEYGDYYAWGETETKNDYSWKTYKWCNGSYTTMTKYCNNSDFGNDSFTDTLTVLTSEDDVAYVKWGGNWRMPTKEELYELYANCTWTWTIQNGVNGYRVTSNKSGYTDNSIFLPAAGYRSLSIYNQAKLYSVGDRGYYWSSSLSMDSQYGCYDAYEEHFDSSGMSALSFNGRNIGHSVRPVCPSEKWFSRVEISNVENKIMLVGSSFVPIVVKQNDVVLKGIINLVVWSSDNPTVAIVDNNGIVTALSAGTAHITASIQTLSAQCTVTVIEEPNVEPEYVDLGLSVKWATFNVGALSPEDFGAHYAWGETETKSTYDWSTYKWCNGSSSSLTKYNTISDYGTVDNKTILDPEDDVAHVKWGSNWRMPTKAEQEELRNNCTWIWYSSGNTEFNGVAGYKVTSNKEGYTDRYIFLPVAGWNNYSGNNSVGLRGCYWSSSLFADTDHPDGAYSAYSFSLSSDRVSLFSNVSREEGRSVRPVCQSEEWLSLSSISIYEDNKTLLVNANASLNVVIKQNNEVLDNPVSVTWSSDDPSIAVVNERGFVTAISAGTAHITASIQTLFAQCTITVIEESNVEPEYVDLGLSVKWATFNVGALLPEDIGIYYAWGETESKTDFSSWYSTYSTYKWSNGSSSSLTKYNTNSDYGMVDNKTTLDPEDDVAHVKWGGNWRMPTHAEQNELCSKCTWTWYSSGNSEYNGVSGYKVTSNMEGYTDRFIFLPAAGYHDDMCLYNVVILGGYWSSSLMTDGPLNAYYLGLSSSSVNKYPADFRYYGFSVRPVCP